MKKIKIILVLIFILSAAFVLGYFGTLKIKRSSQDSGGYLKQSSVAGTVEVGVVPKELKAGQEMVFTVTLDNHIIDLNYDYTKIAAVVDDKGNVYKPTKWMEVEGGHHVTGDLIFNKLSGKARSIGLNINGIDSKNVVFNWDL